MEKPRVSQKIKDRVRAEQQNIQQRVQKSVLWGPLLGALGLVSLFYGLEKLIDQTVIAQSPWLLVLFGVGLLLGTGSYYDKL